MDARPSYGNCKINFFYVYILLHSLILSATKVLKGVIKLEYTF